MNKLQIALSLIDKEKKESTILKYMNDEDMISFIAEQSLGIMGNGEIAKPLMNTLSYHSTINAFGKLLVDAAIDYYIS